MSNRYKGGIISATPPTTNGPYENGAASGAWTLEQQMRATAAGTWPTAGNINPDAFIENLFQAWLYTGNGSTQTITNGIDPAGRGGLVWIKSRSNSNDHFLYDTSRGTLKNLYSNYNVAEATNADSLTAFNSNGFSLGSYSGTNSSGTNFVSWTFRKQPKFFDVVTWTGNGANRTIAHNLGSVPGMIIVKRTDASANWQVYHRSLANTQYMVLNDTAAVATGTTRWNSTTPTDTVFSLGTNSTVNASGGTYVAYIYAHDAGGFGLTGTDNVISCGSFTTDGSGNASVTLGYEPQWIFWRNSQSPANWWMADTMRGLNANGNFRALYANLSNAEGGATGMLAPNATGFSTVGGTTNWAASATHIYIAIRRGPMAVPTTGTSVYYAEAVPQGDSQQTTGVPFPPDLVHSFSRDGTSRDTTYQYINFNLFMDRLRGMGVPSNSFAYSNSGLELVTSETIAETKDGYIQSKADGMNITRGTGFNSSVFGNFIYHFFRRAPSVFDVVCYDGTGSAKTVAHNLAAAPELMIIKSRPYDNRWAVYYGNKQLAYLESNAAGFEPSPTVWNDTVPTSTVFSVGNAEFVNQSGNAYVAYLFATCPGVSKVGSYTGTGTTQTINCGFAAGARFVLIKRTDSTGDWYVWDSARGIVAGNDPYLLLNSNAAEVTNTDYVDTAATGFEISSTAPAAINASGGTFIFLAIA
jgi:hypothetical protein